MSIRKRTNGQPLRRRGAFQVEGQHIRRAAIAQISAVEPAHLAIVHHGHVKIATAPPQACEGRSSDGGEATHRHAMAPLAVLDADAHAGERGATSAAGAARRPAPEGARS